MVRGPGKMFRNRHIFISGNTGKYNYGILSASFVSLWNIAGYESICSKVVTRIFKTAGEEMLQNFVFKQSQKSKLL
jgi:hypothetical protein